MSDQTPRDLCTCGGIATITIGSRKFCRACCEQVRIQSCRQLGRKHLPHQIGTVLQETVIR